MPSSDSSRDVVLERLAAEFVERHRRGEHPPLSEYTGRHPDLAEDIRDLFPALVQIECLKPAADPTGAFEPPSAIAPDGAKLERLGEYRILREVGRGGMGVVYEAEQESLGRHVALKVLPTSTLLNPTYLERFRREAKAAARLHHTNIVPVFGTGESNGVPFYAMQFIRGEGLDRVLADVRRLRHQPGETLAPLPSEGSIAHSLLIGRLGPPTVAESGAIPRSVHESAPTSGLSVSGSDSEYCRGVARIGAQVAEGLAYAHRQGILHRDIKPSNLLLDAQGTVWITDFGLAKAEGTDELTHTGDIVGTVRFMAPERFEGKSLPQSDVYALGLTLYELLTLRPAFDHTNKAKLIDRVLHDPPTAPRKINPLIPRDLETIVLKCLAKEPGERYAGADALAEDLRRFLADRPIKARRASNAERFWRWCRRNPAVASLLGTVAGLLIVVAIGSLVTAARFDVKRRQADDAREEAVVAERKARLREAEALVGEAHGIRYSRRSGQRFAALAALKKAAVIGRELEQPKEWFDRLRNEAIAALALADIHITEEWNGFPPGTETAAVSPDFERYARTTPKGAVFLHRAKDDAVIASLPERGEACKVWWHGPGLLAVHADRSLSLHLYDVRGSNPILRLDEKLAQGWDVRPDGKQIVVVSPSGRIAILTVADGKPVHQLAPESITRFGKVLLHPTAPFVVAFSYRHPFFEIRDVRTGEQVGQVIPPWPGGMGEPAWSPDGRMLAMPSGNEGKIQLYAFDPDTTTLRPTRLLEETVNPNGGLSATFNPAGDRLVARGWNLVVHLWDVHTGRQLFTTHALPFTHWYRLGFDPTGTRLAEARVGDRNERLGIWSVADGREYRVLAPRRTEEVTSGRSAVVHPDGRLVAQAITNGVVLFDLESGEEVAFLPIPFRRWGPATCFDGTGALLTNTFSGFLRWPVRADPDKPGRWTIGPPEALPFHPGNNHIAASRDGRVVAQAMWDGYGMSQYAGGWILHPNSPRPRRVRRAGNVGNTGVSPDGRWVIFSDEVYEAATARLVWLVPESGKGRFSHDGRTLLTTADGGRVYEVGTWKPGCRLGPGHPRDVSPDNRLVVMGMTNGIYRLVELADGREIARLEDPDQTNGPAVLSPDGTRLLVTAKDNVRVWDLRRIREKLSEMDLDWDAPAFPEPSRSKPAVVEVEVIGAELADPKNRPMEK